MTTGSGKTYTAISAIYRLIKFAGARRVLFLVDRANLGRQALKEFQSYVPPDDNRHFHELYNVRLLSTNRIDPVSKVVITTVQRLYSMLQGEEELDPALEEGSQFDAGAGVKTNLLFFTKGTPTQSVWYYDLSNIKVGKKLPFTLDRFTDFFRLLPDRGESDRSWTVTRADLEARSYDLKAVNPHARVTEDTRTPAELLDLIEAKGQAVAQALAELRGLTAR